MSDIVYKWDLLQVSHHIQIGALAVLNETQQFWNQLPNSYVYGFLTFKKELKGYTYIIGHYNPSVRIIDQVSHTTYVVCITFIHKWRALHFKVDSERQIF